ncbi:MAG TPA: biopolymer transporter ExbD [Thermoanaerobaculia bacterium]|nr:biopolymer transporter ExbD [Thermoanaerobaculia bacterium]
MSMGGGGSRDKIQSDINVTPLVDVCLVLLIIFMVVTPLLQNGISVQLPVTTNPDKKPEGEKQKVITVGYSTPPGYYLGGNNPMSKAELQKQLEELYARAPQTDLVIKADQRLKYGEVKEVMRITKEAGFQNVGLIAQKKSVGAADAAAAKK